MKNESGSSRIDTVLKMLMMAFISLLAFSSGVYFGKQLSDSDYQLKALESDFQRSGFAKLTDSDTEEADFAALDTQAEFTQASKEPQIDETISQEEIAALSEQFVKSEKAEIAKSEPEVKPAVAASAKPDLSAASKAAMRIAQNAAPTEPARPKEPNRVPSSLPKTVGTSQDVQFTVQVASYPTPEAAQEHANELIKQGFPAFPVQANVQGKTWYRVSVGTFKTQKEAMEYRAQLLKQTSLPSAIIQKIQR